LAESIGEYSFLTFLNIIKVIKDNKSIKRPKRTYAFDKSNF